MDLMQTAILQFLLWFAAMGALIAMVIVMLLATIQNTPVSAARGWIHSQGLIVQSFVSSEPDQENPASQKIWYVPNVSYTYFAQGVQYVARRIQFGALPRKGARDGAEKQLAQYPVGAAVTVYYNPQTPQDAVLERTSPQARRFMWVGVSLLAASIFACIAAFLVPQWMI